MPIKEGQIQFGNTANILLHLGNIYDDDRDVLNEYVSNASDSRAQNIEISLHRHGEASSISTAKEWALYNFKHADRVEVSEKMIELLVRVWKYLDKMRKQGA